MELKATLNKPYEEKARLDFIVEQNHKKEYEIKDTETALEAWGYTEEEKQTQAKEAHRKELMAQLDTLDLKCIRSLRAIQTGKSTDADTVILADYEKEAEAIRKQLRNLGE